MLDRNERTVEAPTVEDCHDPLSKFPADERAGFEDGLNEWYAMRDEREREELREKTWADLEEGQVRPGVVRSVKDFGAFTLGGIAFTPLRGGDGLYDHILLGRTVADLDRATTAAMTRMIPYRLLI